MRYAALSDVGLVRSANEDSYCGLNLAPSGPWLFAVADGMGGGEAGDWASATAVNALAERLRGCQPGAGAVDWPALVGEAFREINRTLHARALTELGYGGMGTTLTAALVVGYRLTVGHVGDSRAYLVAGAGIRQLTDDHSLVGELVRKGSLTEKEAMHHPQKNILTRALGVDPEVAVDVLCERISPGDTLVLCTDGLTGLISTEEIRDRVAGSGDLQKVARDLVHLANERGGHDNITVVIARV